MDLYQALKEDHDQLKVFLDQLVELKRDDDYRFVLINEIDNLLIPHSRAEEVTLYNSLRAVNADRKVTYHGFKEHAESEVLLRKLQAMDRMDCDWKISAEKLRSSILHHIEEEESDIFAEARMALTQAEAQSLCEAFLELKKKVSEEGMIQTTADLFINMMPPRLVDRIRKLGEAHP